MAYGRIVPALIALVHLAYICSADYDFYGCIRDGPGDRALPTLAEASDSMTVERCREKARNRGMAVFGVEYGRECYAGNDLNKAVSAYGNSTNCIMSCAGNSTQTCGGSSALSLYFNANLTAEQSSAQPMDFTYQGCYADAGGSRRMTQLWVDAAMTVEFCARLTQSEGYVLFGLQYATECWAANDLGYVTALGASNNCDSACGGNSSQLCGGGFANSVYNNSALDTISVPPTQPVPAPPAVPPAQPAVQTPPASGLVLPSNVAQVGCYADTWDRLLKEKVGESATMTVSVCAQLAADKKYTVFGIQYSVECWAGNDLTKAISAGPSTACTMSCYQMPIGSCGGPLANSIFTQTLMPDNVTPVGCYADTWDRLLQEKVGESATMTVSVCSQMAAAKKYTVFGIQYAAECWAGTDLTKALSAGTSTACNMNCYQMPVGSCGGPLANSIYTQSLTASPAPAAVKSTLNLTPYGCFADKFAPDRAMDLIQASDTMTVDACATLANSQGYTVIGVQYAKECYAGLDVKLATRWGAATNCDSLCYSDPANTCGGGLANSIYLLPSVAATVPPPSPTPPPVVADPPVVTTASPPVPPPAPAGQLSSLNITLLGCYGDGFGNRALPAQLKVSTTMTVNECAQLAWSNPAGFTVFGVQYGQECYASKNETKALQYGPSNNCNSRCYDSMNNPVGTCGGGLANSVYRLPYRPPPPPPPPSPYNETLVGCYADGNPRALSVFLGVNDTGMTVAMCAGMAYKVRYTIFALQVGQECWAAQSLDEAQQYGPSDNCITYCKGDIDKYCGGPGANQVYTMPPIPPPASTPSYTYLGCYQDDQVFDSIQKPPMPIKRRMWRRLAQSPQDMDNWECAVRAKAARYPYFGITSGEVFPEHGLQCWGGYNLTHITELGTSDQCTNRCHTFPGSETCGGNYAISLYQLDGVQYDPGAGGKYQFLLEMPVAGSHNMQVTGKDQFLLIDFLDFDHPKTWDRRNTTYMYFRGNNSFRAVRNVRDASCGQWHRMPDGDMMGFSGYMGASGVNLISVWATMWYHRHQYDTEDFGDQAMPYGRWYGGTILMPDGRSYVTGGDLGPGTPRALGSDIWDPAHKTWVGRYNSMGLNTPYLPLNQPLWAASTSGGYYPGVYVLPSGAYIFSQSKTVQVINPLTGEALAACPPLPRPNYWEYPLSGSQVVLRTDVLKPDDKYTFWFMIFGGGDVADYFKPCTDFSMRIPIYVDCTTSPCAHSMGDWEIETMLGSRCMLDTAVLPNGKVLIIGGTEEGLSNLEVKPNGCNGPVNEPWIYDPDKPSGQRYRRTGAYTNIARFYHNSHTMTSYGDILVSGSTIAKFFESYHLEDFDITPYSYGEFRIELFKPHYILGPRPTWAYVPNMISYGDTFTVKLASNTTAASIATVVMGDPGTTTHSSNMATRMQQLLYAVVDDRTLTVTAPANSFLATPTFYQLYLVAIDDSYSVGAWVKLRGPWGSIPLSLPRVSQFVANASTRAEDTLSPWSVSSVGSNLATLLPQSAAAAGSGSYGLLLTAGDDQPIIIAGPAVNIDAGTRVHTFLWARAPMDNQVHMDFILLNASEMDAGTRNDPHGDFSVAVSGKYEQFPLGGMVPAAAGAYKPALRIKGMSAGMTLHLDDIEVFTLTAVDAAQSLQWARDGVKIQDQLGSNGRKLLEAPQIGRKVRRLLHANRSSNAAGDSIKHNTMNGWMGVLTTDTLTADKPELKKRLKERDDPWANWDPLQNITVAHMTRWKHSGVKYQEWTAATKLKKGKGRQLQGDSKVASKQQLQSDNQGVIKLCEGALPCLEGF